jgi:GrpB-like predicted nucleotidyltransferase (UPF0157 family)
MNKTKKIEISKYNPDWPNQFQNEAKVIKKLLSENVISIEHIGSTSITGLDAKRDIDILLVIKTLEYSIQLQKIGYIYKGEVNIPLRYFFSKQTEEYKINLHVCEPRHGFISLNLTFRDWIRNNTQDKYAYKDLKYKILSNPSSQLKENGHLSNYCLNKDNFIKNILRKANYEEENVNFCMHNNEISYIESSENIKIELNKNEKKYFILYKGAEIVGYCIIELGINQISYMRKIQLEKDYLKTISSLIFFKIISKWLKFNGYHYILTDIDKLGINFYHKLGFEEIITSPKSFCNEFHKKKLIKTI